MSYFVTAYLLIWLFLMGYLIYLSRKQNKIRKGIDFLQGLIDSDKSNTEISSEQAESKENQSTNIST